jgi:hypothetical protein
MTPAGCSRRTKVVRRRLYATVVLACDGVEVASWALVGWGRPDLAVVDQLARLRLAAGRGGCSIQLRDPCVELTELLDLLGWGDRVAGTGLALEAGGESERPEQVDVEEVVVPDDPVG